jgi:hypothetical protein
MGQVERADFAGCRSFDNGAIGPAWLRKWRKAAKAAKAAWDRRAVSRDDA